MPKGREAEYFSLYEACERGTSWLGTLVFGLMHQWLDSYRPAIVALLVFFVVGMVLLSQVDARRGIELTFLPRFERRPGGVSIVAHSGAMLEAFAACANRSGGW